MDPSSSSPRPATTPTSEFLLAEARRSLPTPRGWRTEQLLAVVVGGHPRSEISDRPLAEWLVRAIRERLAASGDLGGRIPVVVTDLWFLNDRDLMSQPSIAIGDPTRNAVTAWQATRLPRSLVVDGSFAIHCDPEFLDGGVCLWGEGAAGLDAAFEAFATRYLDRYLRQMHLAAA